MVTVDEIFCGTYEDLRIYCMRWVKPFSEATPTNSVGFKFFLENETFESSVPNEPGVYILNVVKGNYKSDEKGALTIEYTPTKLFVYVKE